MFLVIPFIALSHISLLFSQMSLRNCWLPRGSQGAPSRNLTPYKAVCSRWPYPATPKLKSGIKNSPLESLGSSVCSSAVPRGRCGAAPGRQRQRPRLGSAFIEPGPRCAPAAAAAPPLRHRRPAAGKCQAFETQSAPKGARAASESIGMKRLLLKLHWKKIKNLPWCSIAAVGKVSSRCHSMSEFLKDSAVVLVVVWRLGPRN